MVVLSLVRGHWSNWFLDGGLEDGREEGREGGREGASERASEDDYQNLSESRQLAVECWMVNALPEGLVD